MVCESLVTLLRSDAYHVIRIRMSRFPKVASLGENCDSLRLPPQTAIFCVFDGHGAHGDIVSREALNAIYSALHIAAGAALHSA